MVCKILSFYLEGLDAVPVTVEVDVRRGLPAVHIIGLGDRAVLESRIRVAAAINNAGFTMPMSKIIINLAPADRYKFGTALDLPIAIGILVSSGQLKSPELIKLLRESIFWGELSLLGNTARANGAIAIAMASKTHGMLKVFLPSINAGEAGIVAGIKIIPVVSLAELIKNLAKNTFSSVRSDLKLLNQEKPATIDFSEIYGLEKVKRALEIVATGNHNILIAGAPGGGKTMLCHALSGILPRLNNDEALEVLKIQSITGKITIENKGEIQITRPFRSPHHSATLASIIGGGARLKPGEVTMAHQGVLFFDECNCFSPIVLDALREPLEQGEIILSRSLSMAKLPAKFIFVAAINPCPCGNWGSETGQCKCKAYDIARFANKLSAPLLDRIDLQVKLEKSSKPLFDFRKEEESSKSIRGRIETAKKFRKSLINVPLFITYKDLEKREFITDKARLLLGKAVTNLNLSNRKILKLVNVARTIADLRQAERIDIVDLSEAITYRMMD